MFGMITVQSVSQTVFLFLAFGLPVLAVGLGVYGKPRWLAGAFGVLFAIMIVYLIAQYHVVETGMDPQATGMEGIALFVIPAMYVASAVVSTGAYLIAGSMSRRRNGL